MVDETKNDTRFYDVMLVDLNKDILEIFMFMAEAVKRSVGFIYFSFFTIVNNAEIMGIIFWNLEPWMRKIFNYFYFQRDFIKHFVMCDEKKNLWEFE